MQELGIDIRGHRSKHVEEFADRPFDYIITVCDNARESRPVFWARRKNCITISKILRPSLALMNNFSLYFGTYGTDFETICESSLSA